jgi:hypothetical protein
VIVLVHLYSLFIGLPTLLKYLGLMRPDFVPLTEDGEPWSEAFDFATEPVYTATKPDDKSAALAGASVLYSFFNIFK